ncbi:hypothetical protein Mp_3g06580 [Marchantia polymorpha subsp. ruderalis]|uniref:Uncharacterized protein n=2 Tax=Marchantia polymorpha TaxID=3197 RepID=A0AAF6AY25_MARPO|nr:hypothetical protein MARPO_0006s0127 [Marchantia polymorpha]BBN04659.1 hypothetical protein Mp_3g06580 [Marchantia polymorpha subsp. ruderalis]|eukprot:PTQ48097.1 hypothetical protein MARPO_0006s0127 [Marchantia polymorpha]
MKLCPKLELFSALSAADIRECCWISGFVQRLRFLKNSQGAEGHSPQVIVILTDRDVGTQIDIRRTEEHLVRRPAHCEDVIDVHPDPIFIDNCHTAEV